MNNRVLFITLNNPADHNFLTNYEERASCLQLRMMC